MDNETKELASRHYWLGQKERRVIYAIDRSLFGAALFYTILQDLASADTPEEQKARLNDWIESPDESIESQVLLGEQEIKNSLYGLEQVSKTQDPTKNKLNIWLFDENMGHDVEAQEIELTETQRELEELKKKVDTIFVEALEEEKQQSYAFPLMNTLAKIAGIQTSDIETTF